ncbi:MAG TPA: GTP 3',8-cyclase MoaA [Kofleriaceae bacterium]|nr:GTP 3',8-cyclase MoaA [Kofleriaceae bacterium]
MSRVFLPVLPERPAPRISALGGPPGADLADLADLANLDEGRLLDGRKRRVRYLRVSVTDRCNFRCTYCRPEEDLTFGGREELLTFEELERVVRVFARLGVRKLRLTGGEPTVRAGIVELVARLSAVPGIEQVVMTSNGHLLGRLAAPLFAAGLSSINISLDTLCPERFAQLTGGQLAPVVQGIDAALAAGLQVKLNIVALAEINRAEISALCRFAWERQIVPRFIEHMPMSSGHLFASSNELTAAEIRATVERELGPLVPSSAPRPDGGPARYWRGEGDPRRELGIISAMTEHFCDDCNRLRLTAAGDLHACLGHDDAVSLRQVLRRRARPSEAPEAEDVEEDEEDEEAALVEAISGAVGNKREGHEFQRSGAGAPGKHMISIGG